MNSSGLAALVCEILRLYYKNSIFKEKEHVASRTVWLDLVSLFTNELVLLGYDRMEFTQETMDAELEKFVINDDNSSIGMDWEKGKDGDGQEYESFHYWIED